MENNQHLPQTTIIQEYINKNPIHNTMKNLLESIHEELKPQKDPSIQPFIQKVRKAFKDSTHQPKIHVGGSYAKNTHIGKDYDVDIFIKYDKKHRDKPISDYTETVLQRTDIQYKRVHGSRDYFITTQQRQYELIPVLDIQKPSQAETVVDNSPLHVAYTKQRLTPTKKKHIRLLKQFLKAQEIYGAESYIGGFSGHVVDLLILHYKTLPKLLEATQNWKPKTVIDIENHHDLPLHTLNESKTQGPLILIDPIQKHRNAAAAVTKKAYNKLKQKAKQLQRNPTKKQFYIPTHKDKLRKHKEKHQNKEVLELTFTDTKKDISGDKLIKIQKHIQRQLQHSGFTDIHIDTHHADTKSYLYIAATHHDEQLIKGPPLTAPKKHRERFKQKYEDIHIEKGILQTKQPTTYKDLQEALQHIKENAYIQERCETIRKS